VLRIFIALKNPSPWPGFNPQSLGQHTNHYTTKATQAVHIQGTEMIYNVWKLMSATDTSSGTAIRLTIATHRVTAVQTLREITEVGKVNNEGHSACLQLLQNSGQNTK
jgi:hypothetical protein